MSVKSACNYNWWLRWPQLSPCRHVRRQGVDEETKQNKNGQQLKVQEQSWKEVTEGRRKGSGWNGVWSTQGALLTFPTNPAQLSLASHFLVWNHYETVPSPHTNTNNLQHLLLSEPWARLQTSKIPTATDSQRQAFPFGNSSGEVLRLPRARHRFTLLNRVPLGMPLHSQDASVRIMVATQWQE